MWYYVFCCLILCDFAGVASGRNDHPKSKQCYSLSKFQYYCKRPDINPITQQPVSCQSNNSILVSCTVIPGIECDGLNNDTNIFELEVPNSCNYKAHKSFSTALIFSIFLGFLGIDRIYLGYYAIGLFKMFTLGGLFIIWLTDVVLICLQILLPADGTNYIMPYYGPKIVCSLSMPFFTCQSNIYGFENRTFWVLSTYSCIVLIHQC